MHYFPSNNVNEGNAMISNNSGFFQVKARKTLNFQQFILQPKGLKISTTETKMEWKFLNTETGGNTHVQGSELGK